MIFHFFIFPSPAELPGRDEISIIIFWLSQSQIKYHIIFRIPLIASHLPQTMAENVVLPTLESAKGKLEQKCIPFAALPNDPDSSRWTRIEKECGLSLGEILLLQNASAGTTSKSVMFHCLLISIPNSSMCAVSNPYPD